MRDRSCLAFSPVHGGPVCELAESGTAPPRVVKSCCTLYIARHGQTNWNAERIVQGQLDEAVLTSKGKEQAAALAEDLQDITFSEVYCSPMRRARETLDILTHRGVASSSPGRIVRYDPLLMEARFDWQGGTRDENIKRSDYSAYKADMFGFRGLNAHNPLMEARVRAQRFFQNVDEAGLNGNVLVVSHGQLVSTLLSEAAGLGSCRVHFVQANASLSIVSLNNGVPALHTSNLQTNPTRQSAASSDGPAYSAEDGSVTLDIYPTSNSLDTHLFARPGAGATVLATSTGFRLSSNLEPSSATELDRTVDAAQALIDSYRFPPDRKTGDVNQHVRILGHSTQIRKLLYAVLSPGAASELPTGGLVLREATATRFRWISRSRHWSVEYVNATGEEHGLR